MTHREPWNEYAVQQGGTYVSNQCTNGDTSCDPRHADNRPDLRHRCAIAAQSLYAQDAGSGAVYLPLVTGSSATATPTPTSPPTATPTFTPTATQVVTPAPVRGSLFIDTSFKTSSASIQVDAQGTMHLAYTHYEAANNGKPTYAVYLTCAGQCVEGADWNGVGMGEIVNEIQLRLTAAGQPRILFRSPSQVRESGNDYFYAACDQSCTDPTQWQVLYLASSSGIGVIDLLRDDSMPQRAFALDPNGRPRFVYNDGVSGHYGTFYAFCDDNCTDIANWFEVKINKDTGEQGPFRDEDFHYPALTFTAQGQPRIAADGVSMQDEFFLYYLSCDTACDVRENWFSTPLAERGSGPNVSYDIAIDTAGRPRIAYYQGARLGGQGIVILHKDQRRATQC